MSDAITQSIRGDIDRISSGIEKHITAQIFENRYNLHPRQIKQVAREEVEAGLRFFSDHDPVALVDWGRRRAREGVNQETALHTAREIRDAALAQMENLDASSLAEVLGEIDTFVSLYLAGFAEEVKTQILTEQEHMRIALSTSLQERKRELYIKNQAINTSNEAVLIADCSGKATYVNPAFCELSGFSDCASLIGIDIADLSERTTRTLVAELQETGEWRGEIRGKRFDESLYPAELVASLIRGPADEPLGIMTIWRDITLRKENEMRIIQGQKMDALGELAGGISHDFNNILAAITGFAELVLMEESLAPQFRSDIRQIKIAADRGADLTNQLRLFTRQEAAKLEPQNLNEIMSETITLIVRTFPKDVQIDERLDPSLWLCWANRTQVSQIIMNLCVNARDAMEKSAHKRLAIETRNVNVDAAMAQSILNARTGHHVLISVSDTGIGICPEDLPRVYEPFFTTKGTRKGTGLGLAVVYGIIQGHQGFIDVSSSPEEGARFDVYLPAALDERGTPSTVAKTQDLPIGKGTILVADDETQILSIMERALHRAGFTVYSAHDGEEAVALFQEKNAELDAVILDINMPAMNGTECLTHLKRINPDVRVVVMTGQTIDMTADTLYSLGAKRILNKPVNLIDLVNAVNSAIEN